VDYNLQTVDPYEGIKLDLNNEFVRKADKIIQAVYNAKPVYKYSGGGLPIVTLYHDVLGLENVLVPLGNEDCGMHAANENYRLNYAEKGLDFSYEFLKK
jgi:acetylornithine deacetylase/succinyl-diaminopimelate desuccinylase-like protein